MNRSIDVEYKHIANANRKLIVNSFGVSTQTRSVGQQGSELTTLEFVPQVCFARRQPSQRMIPRRNHGDGSDCSLCSLHDGDHRSLQVAQKRSLFGYKIHKIDLSKALKTSLDMSQTAQNRDWRRLRAGIPLEIDFGPILDQFLGAILRSKSSSEGTRSRVQRNTCFQDRFGKDLEPF